MAHPILRYPDGPAGLALAVLRLSASAASFPALAAWFPDGNWLSVICSSALALALAAGLGTRTLAVLLSIALLSGLTVAGDAALLRLSAAGAAAALALLGPGAFSLDARRFGRRVIHVEAGPPDRGGGA